MDINTVTRMFYSSVNSILHKTSNLDDLSRLYLIESYCLPLLIYAIPALNLKEDQINDLNVAWNCVYRRISGFHRWEYVKSCILGLGRLDFKHIRLKLITKFCGTNLNSSNCLFKYLLTRFILKDFDLLCARYVLLTNSKFLLTNAFSFSYWNRLVNDAFRCSVM